MTSTKSHLPLPTITVAHPLGNFKEGIESCEEVFGVKWIYKRVQNKNNTDAQAGSSASAPQKRRIREVDYVWYEDYVYHRSEEKQVGTDTVKGGISGQSRDLQKKSKRIKCPGILKVFCYKEKEMPELLFKEVLETTFNKTSEPKCNEPARKHSQFVIPFTESNLKIQEVAYKRAESQKDSVKIWLDKLKNKDIDTYIGSDYQENFSFGFVSPWQKNLLLASTSFCLDATHNITNIKKFTMYTVVVRNRPTDTGCPVAYFFTMDHYASIEAGKVREYVKLGSFALNNIVHKKIITCLKAMMWEKNATEFTKKLPNFIVEFAEHGFFFIYLRSHYLVDDKFKLWPVSYQSTIFTNMEINNYVESWHNQLKTTYLGSKSNGRADRLIWILINDVEEDYQQNISRLLLNVGRMGPEERRRRKRKMDTEAINENVLSLMVEVEGHGSYNVTSITIEEDKYKITVENNVMTSCSCPDFTWNQTPFPTKAIISIHVPQMVQDAEEQPTEANVTTMPTINTELVSNGFENLKVSFNSYLENPHELTTKQMKLLQSCLKNLNDILIPTSERPISSNSQFTTQRR
ncbi:hypothetical protein G6F43_009497 [Rhizopus delemar]|nr:hypothetical protein G6F43_009497 [Rhizopus delemar]